ncbi:hypothetical protein AAG570_000872 [Ranatra chinensis]|uniref:Cytochrome P450 n=1 Tax=Ranatra chinensis TaxID=642074 RepID=A0ABD0Z0E9_9HEMI
MLAVLVWWLAVVIGGMWLMTRPLYWWWRGVSQGGGVPVPLLGTCWPPSRLSRGFSGLLNYLYSTRGGHSFLGFHFFVRPCLLIADPQLINDAFVKNFDTFKSRSTYVNQKRDIIARNVIHLGGDQWRSVRTKMTPYFTPARIKKSLDMAATSLKLVEEQLDRGGTVDVHALMTRYTTHVLTGAFFGVKSDVFDNKEDSFFYHLQRALFDPGFGLRIFLSIVSPWIYDLTRSTLNTPEATRELKDLTFRLIEGRLKNKGHDLMQAMVDQMEKDSKTIEDKYLPDDRSNLRFDMLTITAQMMALYTGGTESSGTTLGFALYEMAVHTSIQDRARAEVRDVLARSHSAQLDYDALQKMRYVNMVISETLRKYPIFNFLHRKATSAYNIPGTDIVLETGTRVFVPVYSIHHDPNYYPDPERFDPDRFTEEEIAKRPAEAYIPFGIGPRYCIGVFSICSVEEWTTSLRSFHFFSIKMHFCSTGSRQLAFTTLPDDKDRNAN